MTGQKVGSRLGAFERRVVLEGAGAVDADVDCVAPGVAVAVVVIAGGAVRADIAVRIAMLLAGPPRQLLRSRLQLRVDDAGRGTAARPVLAGGAGAFGDVGRAVRGAPAAGAGQGIRRHAPERSRRGLGANRAAHQGGPKPMRCTRTSSGTPAERAGTTARRRTPGRSHRPLQQPRRHLTAVTVRRRRTGSRSSVRVITTDALASAQRGHAETTTALTVANKCPPVS